MYPVADRRRARIDHWAGDELVESREPNDPCALNALKVGLTVDHTHEEGFTIGVLSALFP